jgi:transmembrane sensor
VLGVDELIRAAQADNVVAVGAPNAYSRPWLASRRMRSAMVAGVACLCTLAAGLACWYVAQRSTYATRVGEQRTVTLPDGSSIELNARSRLSVRFSAVAREVDLLEGQALFLVEKDVRRPFVVRSGAIRVRAVGTRFDVYRRSHDTTITVLEGRVAVLPETAASPQQRGVTGMLAAAPDTVVSAGEQVIATGTRVARRLHANVAAATAWRQKRLIFSATPLAEVVNEFNRYNERQLVVRDPRLQHVLVNGVFSSTDPASLVRFLHAQPDIAVDDEGRQISLSAR